MDLIWNIVIKLGLSLFLFIICKIMERVGLSALPRYDVDFFCEFSFSFHYFCLLDCTDTELQTDHARQDLVLHLNTLHF